MPRHARRLKIRRKDLRKPDEFETLTGQAVAWADEHRPVVYAVLAVAAVVLAGSLAIGRWRASRNDAAAVAFRSAQARFDEGKFQDAAQDFAYVVERYPGTPSGRRRSTPGCSRTPPTPRRRPSSRRRSPAQRDPRAAPPKVRPTAIPSARRGPAAAWHADGALSTTAGPGDGTGTSHPGASLALPYSAAPRPFAPVPGTSPAPRPTMSFDHPLSAA